MASLSPVAAKEPVAAFWPPPLAPLALCDSGSRRPRLARCRRLGQARPGHLSRARIHLHTTHSSRIDQAGFHGFLPSISARVISRRLAASQPSLPGHPGLSSVVHETQSLPSRRRVSLPSPRAEANVNFPAKESKSWFRDGKPGSVMPVRCVVLSVARFRRGTVVAPSEAESLVTRKAQRSINYSEIQFQWPAKYQWAVAGDTFHDIYQRLNLLRLFFLLLPQSIKK
jgi:hypothetical protein